MGVISNIREFAGVVAGEYVIIARGRDDWSMSVTDKHPRLILPYDVNKNDAEDKLFRQDFIRRYSGGRGFANITISILHEIGHWKTRNEVDWELYWAQQENVFGQDYFNLPAERMATDWAINWLSDPEHRKIAKEFEARHFGY